MDITLLKERGVRVSDQHNHLPRPTINDPLPMQIFLWRGTDTITCTVYLTPDDPCYHSYLEEDDYLRLVVHRYTMNVADFDLLANPLRKSGDWLRLSPQQRWDRFDRLSPAYRELTTKANEAFRLKLRAFIGEA